MSYLFSGSRRKDFSGIESWDVSNVTNMSEMFCGAEFFNHPIDSWDVSNVRYMDSIFSDAKSFNQPLDSWDVSNVEDMSGMFNGAKAFNQNLDSWRVAKDIKKNCIFLEMNRGLATSGKKQMFIGSGMSEYPSWLGFPKPRKGANGKYTPLSREELADMVCDESIYLGDIDTSHITDMSGLFMDSWRKDFSGIESWDVSNVEIMYMMFINASSFNEPLNSWDVSKVKDMCGMFSGASSFNQPLDKWDVSNVRDMDSMFFEAKAFSQPLDKWNVSNVENMRRMFEDASSFNQNLDAWQVQKDADMREMFENSGMKQLPRWFKPDSDDGE